MSAQPARGYLGISEVLAELRADFPDISVSKIRFLETEGLITPARSPAGYRRFGLADLDRLRFILAAQRDQYLPLRVIRDRLDRMDEQVADGEANVPAGLLGPPGGPSAGSLDAGSRDAGGRDGGRPSAGGRGTGRSGPGRATSDGILAGRGPAAGGPLTRRELVEAAGLSEALLTELETFGLLRRSGRHYGPEALEVARTAVTLTSFGVEARHLRAVRAAAERETTMIESLVAPILRQRGAGARDLASRTARDCATLVLRLHGALVEGALAEAGLGESAASEPGAAAESAGSRRPQSRGVEGATA